jgi:hypothetical protein
VRPPGPNCGGLSDGPRPLRPALPPLPRRRPGDHASRPYLTPSSLLQPGYGTDIAGARDDVWGHEPGLTRTTWPMRLSESRPPASPVAECPEGMSSNARLSAQAFRHEVTVRPRALGPQRECAPALSLLARARSSARVGRRSAVSGHARGPHRSTRSGVAQAAALATRLPPISADIAVGASHASWPAGGPAAGYGRVFVNGT